MVRYIGIFIVGIVIGSVTSFAYLNNPQDTYSAGFEAAKKLVAESSIGSIVRIPDDIRTLSGMVTEISGNRITVRTQSMDPFEDASLANRTVLITDATKIVKLSYKDIKVFQDEWDAFTEATQSAKGGTPLASPEPFIRTPSGVASIAVGDTIGVTAEENIKTTKEFTASEVQIRSF